MRTLCLAIALAVVEVATLNEPVSGQASATLTWDFQVDPAWPRPLPNAWKLGPVSGLWTDSQDHVWVLHRSDPPTPAVLQFDPGGQVVGSWGVGSSSTVAWPEWPGGLSVDSGGVWITAAGPPDGPDGSGANNRDAHVLKFSHSGRLLLQIGRAGEPGGVDSQNRLNRPVAAVADPRTNEVFVADGGTSQRIAVFDATTGAYRRHWTVPDKLVQRTAYLASQGLMPNAVKPFGRLSAVLLSNDGRVYVGDRLHNAIHVFARDGSTITSGSVAQRVAGLGAVWSLSLSPDPQQFSLFVANGDDSLVVLLNRANLAVQASFGTSGTQPGAFRSLAAVAVDSRGRVYTGEAQGQRLQRFVRNAIKKD